MMWSDLSQEMWLSAAIFLSLILAIFNYRIPISKGIRGFKVNRIRGGFYVELPSQTRIVVSWKPFRIHREKVLQAESDFHGEVDGTLSLDVTIIKPPHRTRKIDWGNVRHGAGLFVGLFLVLSVVPLTIVEFFPFARVPILRILYPLIGVVLMFWPTWNLFFSRERLTWHEGLQLAIGVLMVAMDRMVADFKEWHD